MCGGFAVAGELVSLSSETRGGAMSWEIGIVRNWVLRLLLGLLLLFLCGNRFVGL